MPGERAKSGVIIREGATADRISHDRSNVHARGPGPQAGSRAGRWGGSVLVAHVLAASLTKLLARLSETVSRRPLHNGSMSLNESIQRSENVLRELLLQQQEGVDDRTGKGTSTEAVVERYLIRPHLPPPFRCQKGAVVAAAAPSEQSAAIDRVVHDPTEAPPLVYGDAHSIFPIEAVAGLVEITMRLNATKLKQDVQKIAPIQNLRRRRYIVPAPDSVTQAYRLEADVLSPRGFLIGLPEDPNWRPETIASVIREAQLEAAGDVKIHGVYIVGIGYFSTIPASDGAPPYRVRAWTDDARLFRFTNDFRTTFQRWPRMEQGWAGDLDGYVDGSDPRWLAP